jgi:uncharacterized protein (TIGR00255 family)
MISSMTGYAREQSESEWGNLTWEVRSVNHRYLETSFRLPEQFRYLEIKWRQLVAKELSRGKVDLTLKFQPGQEMAADFELNQPLLEKLSGYSKQLADFFPNAQTEVSNMLNWPGVIQAKSADMELIAAAATDTLRQSLVKLESVRANEGAVLLEFFEQHLALMRDYVAQVATLLPEVLATANQRIRDRFSELKLELDQSRLEQELTWLAQKVDVAEEIKRLSLHIDEFGQTLNKGGVIGRRLDFLAQELNREANTLASKSINASVTHLAVELKVLIEQVREQVQNIE